MTLNNLVKAAIFSSTAIGLGFVFMFIPNLEFISVTVFLSGLTLGGYIGAIVGGTSMLVYSGLNPLGSGLIHLPLFISQIVEYYWCSRWFWKDHFVQSEKKSSSANFRNVWFFLCSLV